MTGKDKEVIKGILELCKKLGISKTEQELTGINIAGLQAQLVKLQTLLVELEVNYAEVLIKRILELYQKLNTPKTDQKINISKLESELNRLEIKEKSRNSIGL